MKVLTELVHTFSFQYEKISSSCDIDLLIYLIALVVFLVPSH